MPIECFKIRDLQTNYWIATYGNPIEWTTLEAEGQCFSEEQSLSILALLNAGLPVARYGRKKNR